MISLKRYNVFLPDTGWSYDFVVPASMIAEIISSFETDTIEEALELQMAELEYPNATVLFDEDFERASITENMGEEVPTLVLCDDASAEGLEEIDIEDLKN